MAALPGLTFSARLPACTHCSGCSDGNRTITRNLSLSEDLGQDDSGLSWIANPKDGQDGSGAGGGSASDMALKVGSGAVLLESMLFKDDAKEIGVVEVRDA